MDTSIQHSVWQGCELSYVVSPRLGIIPEEEPLPNTPEGELKPQASESTRRRSCGNWCGGIGEKLKSNLLKVLPALTIDSSQEYRDQDQFRVEGAFVFNNSSDYSRGTETSLYTRPKSVALENGDIPDTPLYELKKRIRSMSGEKHKAVAEEMHKTETRESSNDVTDREPLIHSRN